MYSQDEEENAPGLMIALDAAVMAVAVTTTALPVTRQCPSEEVAAAKIPQSKLSTVNGCRRK